MIKNKKYKKQYQKDQQTINPFDNLNRKSLPDNLIDEKEYKSLCIVFTKFLDETNESFFINMNLKIKLNLFSNKK